MREGLKLSKAHRQEAMRFMLQAIARAGNEIQTAEAVHTLSIDPTHKEAWWARPRRGRRAPLLRALPGLRRRRGRLRNA